MIQVRAFVLIMLAALFVLVNDLLQRTLLPLILRCFPGRREYILGKWCHWIAGGFVAIAKITGVGDFPVQPCVRSDSKTLILMNHQSLLDIPLVIRCIQNGYPLIVTRERYSRGIPLISKFVNLYDFPTVNPESRRKDGVKKFIRASASKNPVVLFPEGTRSRTGDLLSFKTGALKVLFDKRRWNVYLIAADGAWPYTTFKDIASLKGRIRWKMKLLGPFDSPENLELLPGWIQEMESYMREGLASLRKES